MAFEYVVDRESEFGTVTFRSIDINKIHKPSKKAIFDAFNGINVSSIDEITSINNHRLVDIRKTAMIVFRIELWLHNNGFQFGKDFLVPENSKHSVSTNNSLLTNNKLLSFNEALFLLLGIDVLMLALPYFAELECSKYKKNHALKNNLENIFFSTAECKELQRSLSLKNGYISSSNLIQLAKDYNFFNNHCLRLVLSDKKVVSNKEAEKRNKQIFTLWMELQESNLDSLQTNEGKYNHIKIKLKLPITPNMIGKIIRKPQ